MEFPILIDWSSLFPVLGVLGGIFYFYSNFNRTFWKSTVCSVTAVFTHVPQKGRYAYTG